MAVSDQEVAAAEAFLKARGVKPEQVSPALFAHAAQKLKMKLSALFEYISYLYDGEQSNNMLRKFIIKAQAMKDIKTQKESNYEDPVSGDSVHGSPSEAQEQT